MLFFSYQVPQEAIDIQMRSSVGVNGSGYTVEFCDDPWGFRVIRKSTKRTIFDTCYLPDLTYSSQFLQITARIASENLYGFGEHAAHSFRRDMNYKRWSMWARDEGVYNNSWNLYGHQPFYLNLEEDGNAHGVLLLNSNAMDVFLQPAPAITFRTTGGVLDFYFFMGPEPDTVIQQYVSAIGLPALPPYWALGFHLCRWGYSGTDEINSLLDNMTYYGVPQDGQWTDIDYMAEYYDFTYDHSNAWIKLPDLVNRVHKDHKKYVLIFDAGIPNVNEYTLNYTTNPINVPYQPLIDGLKYNIFIKNSTGDGYFEGKVWPAPNSYFPDYTHPNATLWMTEQLTSLYQNLTIDGLWLDMNEISNFNDDNIYHADRCKHNEFNWPPYNPPVKDSSVAGLYGKTICMDAKQHWGLQYNVHSLYGHSMSMVANKAWKSVNKNKRNFILTRSNFVGTGHHAYHWLGDDQSLWEQMHWSIVGMLEYNLFGIPFVGADICGFAKNTTEPLCRRWTHLGAFYPFSRNHNIKDAVPQDPTAFGPEFADAAKAVLLERYRLLPYMYTLLYYSHTTGSSVVRPLFFKFSNDNQTWDLDTQFLWGNGLMFSPVLNEGANSVDVYYPNWRFYDYYTYKEVEVKGETTSVECNENCIIINTVGGTIIPMQTPNTTTYASRQNPIQLLASLDNNYTANGTLFLDDGETDGVDKGFYSLLQFRVVFEVVNELKNKTRSTLQFDMIHKNFTTKFVLSEVTILGYYADPVSVFVNNTSWTNYRILSKTKTLIISNVNANVDMLNSKYQIYWTT